MLHTTFVIPNAGLPDTETLMTRRETAAYLRKSVPTLERYDRLGIGPKSMRIGGRVYYLLADVRRFAGVTQLAA